MSEELMGKVVTSIETNIRTCAPFGIKDIDEKIGGIHAHELMSISGREGVGKTTFSLWCCTQWLKQGKHIMYFTNEQTKEELLKILAANKFRLDSMAVRNKKLSETDWANCLKYWKEFPEDKFEILDQRQGVLVTSIAAHYLKTKPDIIIVDNLNQINSADPREPRHLAIKRFVEGAHAVVKNVKNEVAIVLLTHLSRDYKKNKNGWPDINSIAESASVAREAHTSLLLHWPWYDERAAEASKEKEEKKEVPKHAENEYYVIIAKARNGRPGHAKLEVDMKYGFFEGWFQGATPSVPMSAEASNERWEDK